jgi:hypothetical protein
VCEDYDLLSTTESVEERSNIPQVKAEKAAELEAFGERTLRFGKL